MPCDVDDPGILSVPPMVSVSIYRGNTLVQFTDGGLAPVPPLADNICAGDACRFEFFTNWLSASVNGSVMEGNAGGTGADGMQVSIVGAGFSLNQSYHCKFETDNASVTTLATVVAVDRMLCNVSEWPVKAETARFDIWQGNMSSATSRASDVADVLLPGPNNTYFEYYTVWQQVTVSTALANGGTKVTIQGFGFQPRSHYHCKFVFTYTNSSYIQPSLLMQHEQMSSEMQTMATILSSKELSCPTPIWLYPAGQGLLSLLHGASLVPLVTLQGLGQEVRFDFSSGWDGMVEPSRASSGGGITLTLTGNGFDKTSEDYECVFCNDYLSSYRTAAKALNSTTIVCEAFPIGKYLMVSEAKLWLVASAGLVSPKKCNLSVLFSVARHFHVNRISSGR